MALATRVQAGNNNTMLYIQLIKPFTHGEEATRAVDRLMLYWHNCSSVAQGSMVVVTTTQVCCIKLCTAVPTSSQLPHPPWDHTSYVASSEHLGAKPKAQAVLRVQYYRCNKLLTWVQVSAFY